MGRVIEENVWHYTFQNVNVGQRRFELNNITKARIIQDRLHANERPKTYKNLLSTIFLVLKGVNQSH
jgi:hypothetical protein